MARTSRVNDQWLEHPPALFRWIHGSQRLETLICRCLNLNAPCKLQKRDYPEWVAYYILLPSKKVLREVKATSTFNIGLDPIEKTGDRGSPVASIALTNWTNKLNKNNCVPFLIAHVTVKSLNSVVAVACRHLAMLLAMASKYFARQEWTNATRPRVMPHAIKCFECWGLGVFCLVKFWIHHLQVDAYNQWLILHYIYIFMQNWRVWPCPSFASCLQADLVQWDLG